MISFPKNSNARSVPTIRNNESIADFLSRLIGELLACEQTDRVRAAHIRQLIDVTADELEIHHDLAALAARSGPHCTNA